MPQNTVTIAVPPANPKANYLAHQQEIDGAIRNMLEKGRYILADECIEFEKEFAEYIGVKYAVGVGSGTEALHLALKACDIGAGDEVITVSHTAVATIAAIELCGAKPVLVDVEPSTYTMAPDMLESAISSATKAVVPVHLYGRPADMKRVMDFAVAHNLKVIEDCAQSHGAEYCGRKTGALGDISAFSFYPTKNLGALGDAGIVVTNDQRLAEKARLLREYGWKQRYISSLAGWNTRMDEIQAAILRVKLRWLDSDNSLRRKHAGTYRVGLAQSGLILPTESSDITHCYHQFVVRSARRDDLQEYLRRCNIGTLIHYPMPVHMQPAYRDRIKIAGTLRQTEKIVDEILSLPLYPELTEQNIEAVIKTILVFTENSAGSLWT